MNNIVVVEQFEHDSHMLMSEVGNIIWGDASKTYTDEEELIALIKDAAAVVITSRGKFSKRVIEAARDLRIIAKCGAPPNNVDIPAATNCGIPVTWTPGSNSTSVAEHALVLMMSLLKHVPLTMNRLKEGTWHTEDLKACELTGKTVGVVGLGQAGFKLTQLLQPFGTEIIGFDPYIKPEKVSSTSVRLVDDIDELLKASDIVTLHCHMCEETRHFINKDKLSKMKKSAYLVNTGRGGLVDEKALYGALTANVIAGAALDVFEVEPAKKENPLFKLDNVIITPHMAGWTKEALVREARGASEEVIRVLKGEKPVNVANPDYTKFA
jgi:D-3-phosphoglycerate dehydrogenase